MSTTPKSRAASSVTRRNFTTGTLAAGAFAGSNLPKMNAETVVKTDEIFMRSIPSSGEMIPALGLGTFETFDLSPGQSLEDTRRVLNTFRAAGGSVIDTSPLYGSSETTLGLCLANADGHDSTFFTTKLWDTGRWLGDEADYERQFLQSRMRLWRETLNCVLVHSLTNTATALRYLKRLKASGHVKYVGVTHFLAPYYDALEALIRSGDLDFVQLNYSIASRKAEERLLPLAADHGVAVMVNMPFEKARVFPFVSNTPLPEWAREIDCSAWSQVFLKFVISHPSVTCVIPATSNPAHAIENMGASIGRLPDAALRKEIIRFLSAVPGFDMITRQPPYPGKSYTGLAEFPLAQP